MKTLGEYLDTLENLMVLRKGHGRIQHVVAFAKVNVIDRQTIPMPVDSEVIGVVVRTGELYLKLKVGVSIHFIDRYFYAFPVGERYMDMPNLGLIDSVRVGDWLYVVFEDDMAWHDKVPTIHPEGRKCGTR